METAKANNESDFNVLDSLTSPTKIIYALLGINLFCLIVLFGPDSAILPTNATLTIPIIGTKADARIFLIFSPIMIIGISLFFQLIMANITNKAHHNNAPSVADNHANKTHGQAPETPAILILLSYVLTPLTLFYLSWKALPRPESGFLIWVAMFYLFGSLFIYIVYFKRTTEAYSFSAFTVLVWAIIFFSIYLYQYHRFPQHLLYLRAIDLIGAELNDKDLRNLDLNAARMDFALLNNANFEGSILRKAKLEKAELTNSIIRGVPLHGAKLYRANLSFANLSHATLIHADLRYANLKGAELSDAVLSHADLSEAHLDNAMIERAHLDDTTLFNSVAVSAVMTEATFRNASIAKSNFAGITAPGINFNSADIVASDFYLDKEGQPRVSDLDATQARYAKIHDSRLTKANLTQADFTCAELIGTVLKETILTEAIFNSTDFKDADLSGADLRGANLCGARNLTCEQLRTANHWDDAVRDKLLKCKGSEDNITAVCEPENCSNFKFEQQH